MITFGKFSAAFDHLDLDGRPGRKIGEFNEGMLTLHVLEPGVAVVRRHRKSERGDDLAAAILHHEGHVTQFEWDQWHREHREAWMDDAKAWAAAAIAADRSLKAQRPR